MLVLGASFDVSLKVLDAFCVGCPHKNVWHTNETKVVHLNFTIQIPTFSSTLPRRGEVGHI